MGSEGRGAVHGRRARRQGGVRSAVGIVGLLACSFFTATTSCQPLPADDLDPSGQCVDPLAGGRDDHREEEDQGFAPRDALADERSLSPGDDEVMVHCVESWSRPVRVDAPPGEHVAFRLAFPGEHADVELQVLTWSGGRAVPLGTTDWGRDYEGTGFRVLSAFAADGPRTFWARARARGEPLDARLAVHRTRLARRPDCREDCSRLLQVPLPVDPRRQGYRLARDSVYAYQYGRRDLLMALLHAGRRMAAAGYGPFEVKRLSRWDGGRPPSHRSHRGGVDVDLSLYDSGGRPVWHALCYHDDRRCLGGPRGFGARPMALLIASFFESGLFEPHGPAIVLIDRAYHRSLREAAGELAAGGLISAETAALFEPDQGILRHVEPHHHHVHIRVGPEPD